MSGGPIVVINCKVLSDLLAHRTNAAYCGVSMLLVVMELGHVQVTIKLATLQEERPNRHLPAEHYARSWYHHRYLAASPLPTAVLETCLTYPQCQTKCQDSSCGVMHVQEEASNKHCHFAPHLLRQGSEQTGVPELVLA